ncbi:hypothetical protein [Bifidobacterium catenulatum]|nr:hypothetical protein [Bifidobacterium catenulatum]
MTTPTTKELLMRVIAMKSPELFDGSDNEPIEVTSYNYYEEGPHLCETCDYSYFLLRIGYRTRGRKTKCLNYEYFDLSDLLRTLDKWDAQHDDTRRSDA